MRQPCRKNDGDANNSCEFDEETVFSRRVGMTSLIAGAKKIIFSERSFCD
jgi:hypothetical protein